METTMWGRGVGRRELLLAGGAGCLTAFSLAGCDLLSTEPEDQEAPNSTAGNGRPEAPQLASLVDAGKLPKLVDRLPERPVVVEPNDRIGAYGETWNSVVLGAADTVWIQNTIGYEGLLRWDPEWTTTLPNVAESVEASEDATEFTITLRRGLKWSDGKPFTADDVVFAFEDVLLNEEITPDPGSWEGATLEKVDDVVVRVRYARPRGVFLTDLARVESAAVLVDKPRHYLEEFHAAHNPNVKALTEAEGYSAWPELFAARASDLENPEKPTLNPWVITTPLGESSRVVAERNPYYWKTDPDGNQLPYIDKVVYEVLSDDEVILVKAANGEFELVMRHVNSLPNKPILAKGREEGGFDFIALRTSYMNEMIVSLNLVHRDPVKREIFAKKDFRIGLSHAINREELIDTVFQRQGEPWQAAPIPESEFYDEEMAKQYTEYDVELAEEHLDRAGYSERDGDGFRLGPDGQRITIQVEVALPALVPFWADAMALVADYWKAVGVETRVKAEDRSLYDERTAANEHDAGVWNGTGGFKDEILGPLYYLPFTTALVAWGIPWAEWFGSRGESGEKPPEATLKQMELYWQLVETPEEEERKELFREIVKIAKEEFYTIGTIRVPEGYGTVSNRMHNVPDTIIDSYRYATPAPTNPAQYFIE